MSTYGRVVCKGLDSPDEQPWAECACGARGDAVRVMQLGEAGPRYVPGEMDDPCRCLRCITCGHVLDEDGCCDHIGCPIYGTFIPVPDVPGSQAHDPASRTEAS
jgi:hypothetical protein